MMVKHRGKRSLIKGEDQHTLRHWKVMSCLTSQLEFFEDIPALIDKGNLVDLEYFDYPEASREASRLEINDYSRKRNRKRGNTGSSVKNRLRTEIEGVKRELKVGLHKRAGLS